MFALDGLTLLDHLKVGNWFERMALATPVQRNGTDEEVGAFIAYLCTASASWIHGQSINMDGGDVMSH